jgi:hypothetical protein
MPKSKLLLCLVGLLCFVAGNDPNGGHLGARMRGDRKPYKLLVNLTLIENNFDPASAYTLQFISAN